MPVVYLRTLQIPLCTYHVHFVPSTSVLCCSYAAGIVLLWSYSVRSVSSISQLSTPCLRCSVFSRNYCRRTSTQLPLSLLIVAPSMVKRPGHSPPEKKWQIYIYILYLSFTTPKSSFKKVRKTKLVRIASDVFFHRILELLFLLAHLVKWLRWAVEGGKTMLRKLLRQKLL